MPEQQDNNGLGNRLKEARTKKNMTQKEVCEKLNIPSVQTLSAYERGINSPTIFTLRGLAELYHVSIDWLVYGEEKKIVKKKSIPDLVRDFFDALNALHLEIKENTDFDGNPTGSYFVPLEDELTWDDSGLQHFEKLVKDLYRLNSVKDLLGFEDYNTLVQKRIAEWEKRYYPVLDWKAILADDDNDFDLPF